MRSIQFVAALVRDLDHLGFDGIEAIRLLSTEGLVDLVPLSGAFDDLAPLPYCVGQFDLDLQHLEAVLALEVDLNVLGPDRHVLRDHGEQFALQCRQVVGAAAAPDLAANIRTFA